METIMEIAHQCKEIPVILGPDRNGKTPLHFAGRYGSNCVVEAIIQSAVSHGKYMVQTILAPDDEGQTPLHHAVNRNYLETTRAIMQTAAELGTEMVEAILAPDKCGNTPLQLAITSPNVFVSKEEAIIRFAIKRGINWKS
jgi:ankyrin repeat protein